ncbi:hypothetical protein CEXT_243591 [Caerostris extrusa]|uniref:Uncharacterized protein n=1 Tax=Caerostris extrusa TaxID=172846 RepID=A0AAV4RX55_CAEEX|nr:hypothetical protein CEXT_243591 [Caerostris extrusa]
MNQKSPDVAVRIGRRRAKKMLCCSAKMPLVNSTVDVTGNKTDSFTTAVLFFTAVRFDPVTPRTLQSSRMVADFWYGIGWGTQSSSIPTERCFFKFNRGSIINAGPEWPSG